MEGFAFKFIQNRINQLRNEEENLIKTLKENKNCQSLIKNDDITNKIFNLQREREKLNKALEYELGVR